MEPETSYILFNSANGRFYPTDLKGEFSEVMANVDTLRSHGWLQHALLIIRTDDNKIVKRYEDLTHLHKSKTL